MNKFNTKGIVSLKESVPKEEKKTIVSKKPLNINKIDSTDRQFRIANCKKCNGNPVKEEFALKDIRGERCNLCWEVISWKKV